MESDAICMTDINPQADALDAIVSWAAWRLLPHDFPPWQTVSSYFRRWEREGVWARIHHTLGMADRERDGRDASPSAAILDSQTVRTADQRGDPKGSTPARRSTAGSGTS